MVGDSIQNILVKPFVLNVRKMHLTEKRQQRNPRNTSETLSVDHKVSNVANTTEQFFVSADRGCNRPIENTIKSTASQEYFLEEHYDGTLGLADSHPFVYNERKKLLVERRQKRLAGCK